jgi:hypothetical protein
MALKTMLTHMLVLALATSPVTAQERQDPLNHWRAFAEQLPPGALVTVHLRSGERVEGHVIEVTAEALHLNPKTRVAVPFRALRFDAIESIDRRKEGMSAGAKVLIWTGIVAGALLGTFGMLMGPN